jgi:hypothetical protein
MDANPMLHLTSHRDILYVYDYSDLSFDFSFSRYKKVHLIAFSCGVFMAGYLKEILPEISSAAAVNGTFSLFDERYGLSEVVINVFKNISLENYMDFRRNYLVASDDELAKFNANSPIRTIESSMAELKKLQEIYSNNLNFDFDRVYSGVDDRVIPQEKQISSWLMQNHIVTPIRGGHFPFFNNTHLEEFLPTLCL